MARPLCLALGKEQLRFKSEAECSFGADQVGVQSSEFRIQSGNDGGPAKKKLKRDGRAKTTILQ